MSNSDPQVSISIIIVNVTAQVRAMGNEVSGWLTKLQAAPIDWIHLSESEPNLLLEREVAGGRREESVNSRYTNLFAPWITRNRDKPWPAINSRKNKFPSIKSILAKDIQTTTKRRTFRAHSNEDSLLLRKIGPPVSTLVGWIVSLQSRRK